MRIRQRGFVLLSIVLILLIGGGTILLTRLNSANARAAAKDGQVRDALAKIQDALVNFVSVNGYLPCPADGTLTAGLAAPAAANATCTKPDGIVPWTTLGLSAAEATDPYENRISYRVFSGPTGLTQSGGASMANCDSVRAPMPVPQRVGVTMAGLCRADHDTSPAQFLSGKGLILTDSGIAVSSVAYVLISHGMNGAGAYRSTALRNAMPGATSSEYGHTQSAGPFMIKPGNTAQLAVTDPAYFDDLLTYITISDLLSRAHVAARDWPDPLPP